MADYEGNGVDNSPKAVHCPTLGRTFFSLNAVEQHLGVKRHHVLAIIAGVRRSSKGYEFEWYDPEKHPAPAK